jgi:hypothetical protein
MARSLLNTRFGRLAATLHMVRLACILAMLPWETFRTQRTQIQQKRIALPATTISHVKVKWLPGLRSRRKHAGSSKSPKSPSADALACNPGKATV